MNCTRSEVLNRSLLLSGIEILPMSCANISEKSTYEEKTWCVTEFKKAKGNFRWMIHGFGLCSPESGEALISPNFGIANEEKLWNLNLYPHGVSEEKKAYVSVFLEREGEEIPQPVTCEISLVDGDGKLVHSKEFPYEKDSTECEEFIARAELLDQNDSLLQQGILTVCCTLTTIRQEMKSWKSQPNRQQCLALDDQKSHSLNKDLGKLLEADLFSDVVVEVGDVTIPAHKVLLVARSPVFLAMFKQKMQETQTNRVVIEDTRDGVFREMLRFLYTNDCKLDGTKFVLELLAAADKYQNSSLKTYCSDYLKRNVTENSVFDIVACADAFGDKQLRQECVEFICRNRRHLIVENDDWKDKLLSSPAVLMDILQFLAFERRDLLCEEQSSSDGE